MDEINHFLVRLENKFGRLGAAIVVTLLVSVFSYFFAFPDQLILAARGKLQGATHNDRFLHTYSPLSRDPFYLRIPDPLPDPYWLSTRHRILGPLIAWCVNLRGDSSLWIEVLADPLIYFLGYLYLRKKTEPFTALIAMLVLSVTLACVVSNVWPGYQDSLAALFLLLSMMFVSPALSALALGIGMFADERIAGAAVLVLLWQALRNPDGPRGWLRDSIIRAAWFALVAGLWLFYFLALLRYLGTTVAAVKQSAYSNFLLYKSQVWLGWYTGLRGAWILPAALAGYWIVTKHRRPAIVFGMGIAIVLVLALSVQDISRTSAIAFPAFLIAVILLHRKEPLLTNHLLIAAIIIQVCSPISNVIAGWGVVFEPLPLVLVDHFAKHPRPLNSGPMNSGPSNSGGIIPTTAP